MAKFRKFRDKNDNKGRSKNITEVIKDRRTPELSNPKKPELSRESSLLSVSSFKGLRDSGLIEIKADPESSPMRAGYPIPAVSMSCPVVEAKYSGSSNISGNILVQMMDSDNSKMLNVIDSATLTARLRYLYLTYERDHTGENKNNLGLNKQMLNTFNEAISDLEATMTTTLDLFTSEFQSSIPTTIDDGSGDYIQAEQIMNALLHYQTVLQNATHPISKYVQTISLAKYANDMGYNRESAEINRIMAQLKKTAYRATINSLGDSLSSEYLDTSWKKQMNVLSSFASRRSNSLDSALKTLVVTTHIPSLKRIANIGSTSILRYDSDEILKATGIWFNPDTFEYDGTGETPVTLSFEQLVYRYCKLIDINTIINFARLKANGTGSASISVMNASGYYEESIKYLNAINSIFTVFKTKMSFVRSALKKLSLSGLVYWKPNNFVFAEDITDAPIIYNALLEDLFAAQLGGCASITYDSNTKRWKSYTLWDKFTGIPKYDNNSGGAFLTFSLRSLPSIVNDDTSSLSKIPLLFDNLMHVDQSFECVAYNRLGAKYILDYSLSNDIGESATFARLDVMNEDIAVKIPVIHVNGPRNDNRSAGSACLKFIQDCCGYGRVSFSDAQLDGCRDSLICFIDFEIDDLTNEMISFCRNFSPFRVSTPDPKRSIGFMNLKV